MNVVDSSGWLEYFADGQNAQFFAPAIEDPAQPVDLITEEPIRNPYLRREVEATRQLVYGRPPEEAAKADV